MSRKTRSPPLDPALIKGALARMMRPMVQLLIRAGITFPTMMDLMRELYVNVAENEYQLDNKKQTDSRISVLTGIHRREVNRLRGAGAPVNSVPPELSLTGRVLTRWLGTTDYTDAEGRPLALPRSAPAPAPSFESLVALETMNVRARTILDEWIDRGLVDVGDNGDISLVQSAIVPESGSAQQIHFFSRNLHDHVAASVSNVMGRTPRFFDRSVHYDGLSEDAAQTLASLSRVYAAKALESANRNARTSVQPEPGGPWRWNFGIYVYVEEEHDASSSGPPNAEAGES